MNLLSQLMTNFSALQLRDRAIAVAVGSVILALGGNLLLMKPLQLEIDRLKALESAHKAGVATALADLANIDGMLARGVDPLEKDRVTRDALLRKIAEADAFLSQDDATGAQVRSLVRSMVEETPDIMLVSFRTMPSQVFYTPPPPPPPKATEKAVETVSKLTQLSSLDKKASEQPPQVKPAVLQKTIYRHGVEITVRGKYTQLVSYMEKLQGFPKRVFWSDANMTVSAYPVAVLKIVIYTLSDQPVAPIN